MITTITSMEQPDLRAEFGLFVFSGMREGKAFERDLVYILNWWGKRDLWLF